MTTWIEKVKETKLRHQSQICKTFEMKLDISHLSTDKLTYLRMLFVEAKWLQNHILAKEDLLHFDTKSNIVSVLNKDRQVEIRELKYLSSQMKQAVHQKLLYAIKALSVKKNKGYKVGRLKYISNYKALTLNQYNVTYRLIDKKYLKLQGTKLRLRINGLNQIPENAEITNATLLQRHNDYYLKVTCFVPKEDIDFSEESVGLDFGLSTTITTSKGDKLDIKISEHKRLRRQQRQLSRKRLKCKISKKYSKNYFRNKNVVNKEYHKLNNRKKDKKNKIVSYIVKTYKTVCVQDENIKAWHSGRFGKSVQHSMMGGIMRDLESKSHTFIKVDRFFPSTQLCPQCGNKNKLELSDRIYKCVCGYNEDRDTKSAICIEREGLKQIPTQRREFTPLEIQPLLIMQVDNKQVESLN